VHARGLGRRFGRLWALAHVDLDVRPGESLLLVGSNGSGKTTLLRVLAGLHKPSAGELEIFGHKLAKEPLSARRKLSLVSHHSFLYARLSALENLQVAARMLGRPSSRTELLPLLAEVGLEDRADTQVGGFSAGMRKRMSLLRVRLEDPQMVMLDEPFAALDPPGRRMVERWVRTFHEEGRTILVASHVLDRAAGLCQRAIVLDRGQVRWRGPASEAAAQMEVDA
jgi:heme ABC exporter ATP-binding subunit CcmA